MNYVFDAEKISLDDLLERISTTDLIPSRVPLLDGLESKKQELENQGIKTFAQLRIKLKNTNQLESLVRATGIPLEYLTLLRREIESYFPKPVLLKEFDWLPGGAISRLEEKGIKDAAEFLEKITGGESKTGLAKSAGISEGIVEDIFRYADLTRVQWVSPTTARMLVEAGVDSVVKLEGADSEVLCESLRIINNGNRFFNGNIGLRDVKRLIHAAKFVSKWSFLETN